ncbi:porin [Roseibium limicola]|uniref:Porin n=1 Tax=Roseibium limicola TaxID=2816037 RepID=A0A939ENE0_9HYPH|nr:porin [Roseibium limicola]MBO0345016.1 porin [Roseibium limicola]
MNFKSVLLAAAAAAAATTAQAADLPVAAEPVDYVKVCDAYGSKFYYIPGTDTCLRVGGRVRVQYTANNFADNGNWGSDAADGYSMYGKGYLYLDARTATEFGLLRAFTELNGSSTGGFGVGSAYIQFGGFTFGYATSQFDIFTGQALAGVVGRNWSDTTTEQLTYAASFGNGLSATVGIESGARRESSASTYDGTRLPDVVATLGVSQGWGSAKLSGALHDVNVSGFDNELGYAVAGGVSFNLPMLSDGSNVFFQAQYADGALAYIGAGSYADVAAGNTVSGYALSGGLYHQATSTVGLALDGSYLSIDDLNVTRYAVDGSVSWTPVSGFVMGVDLGYANTEVGSADTDTLAAAFRVQRTF